MSKQNNSSQRNSNYLHAGQPITHSRDGCEIQVAFLKSPVTSGAQTPGWYKDAWVQISSGEMSPYVSEPEKEIIEAKIIINHPKQETIPENYDEDQNLVIEQLRASLNNLFQSTSSVQTQVDIQNPTLMASYTPQKDSDTQKNTFPPSPAPEDDIYSLADATPTPASSPMIPCRSPFEPSNQAEGFFEYDCVEPVVVHSITPPDVNSFSSEKGLKNRISIARPVSDQPEQLNNSVPKPRRRKVKRRVNQGRYNFDSVSLDDPRVKLAFVFGAGFCIGLGTGYMAWRGNLTSSQNTIVLN